MKTYGNQKPVGATSSDRVESDDPKRVLRNTVQEPPRDQIDRDYNAASWPAGIEPDLARKKQFPQVLTVPPVVLGLVDRGRRVDGAPLVDERGEIDPDEEADGIDPGPESSETERIEREAGVVLDQRLVLFLGQSRNALELGHRFAALLMRTKDFGPREMMTKWKDLTEARLRAARRDLDDVLDGRAK